MTVGRHQPRRGCRGVPGRVRLCYRVHTPVQSDGAAGYLGPDIPRVNRRQEGAPPETIARSWKAQRRLNGKYRRMTNGGKAAPEAVTAVARELAGFVWAEMTS